MIAMEDVQCSLVSKSSNDQRAVSEWLNLIAVEYGISCRIVPAATSEYWNERGIG